jgi:hypothetical protein
MAVEGSLDLQKLPEVLQLIAQQKKTGILTVQGMQDIIAVTFLNGQIVAADALNQTVEEGLAQVLVGERLLTAGDFARATAEHESAGGRLLDLLVERSYIARPGLLRGLRLQTFRLLQQLLHWEKGDFKFYSGDEVPFEDGFHPIAVDELLSQGADGEAPMPRQGPAPLRSVPPAHPRVEEAADDYPRVPAEPAPRPTLRVVRREGEPPAPVRSVSGSAAATDAEPASPFRQMKVEEAPKGAPLSFLPKLVAAGLAVVLAAALLSRPEALILPFPWQTRERADLAQDQRASLYLKIDRAAKTYFLLEGHFPSRLAVLQQAGLLAGGDLRDPQGHAFRYAVTEESYSLQPLEGEQPIAGTETSEAITGNFLLDPEFLNVPTESTAPPLVLLD